MDQTHSKNLLRLSYRHYLLPLFSNKIKSAEIFFLDELGKIIGNKVQVTNVFNNFFVNIVGNMGINNSYNFLSNTDTFDDPLE